MTAAKQPGPKFPRCKRGPGGLPCGRVPGCASCALYARVPAAFVPLPTDPPPTPLLDAVVASMTAPPEPVPAAKKKPCGCKDCDCPEEP